MPDNSSNDLLQRRAVAESTRQVAIEQANRDFATARVAELNTYREKVSAAKDRMAAAASAFNALPAERPTDDPDAAASFDTMVAELGTARSALDALDAGAPDGRDLANQQQAAIDAADAQFNAELAAGFPA